jgi:stage III sporulation protein SpoIIIAA
MPNSLVSIGLKSVETRLRQRHHNCSRNDLKHIIVRLNSCSIYTLRQTRRRGLRTEGHVKWDERRKTPSGDVWSQYR